MYHRLLFSCLLEERNTSCSVLLLLCWVPPFCCRKTCGSSLEEGEKQSITKAEKRKHLSEVWVTVKTVLAFLCPVSVQSTILKEEERSLCRK